MSWGLRASLLIAVNSYDGQWCALGWLSDRLRVPPATVQQTCDALVAERQLEGAVIDGVPHYGVHVAPAATHGGLV